MEAAVPQVEQTANALLDMFGGGLNVSINTTKQTKTVGEKDTLEIVVDDGMTQRHFATYSGGEGFRINFALRVALAELVAQRSGLDLSMLVIDEPEGLDASGRDALVQAINTITDRFQTIILISHHDDLRDALPQRIVVTKSEKGSVATMTT
jgi:exonuclease SbcC